VADGLHLLIANDIDLFAQSCVRLLDDEHDRDLLTVAAHRLTEEGFSGPQSTTRSTRVLYGPFRLTNDRLQLKVIEGQDHLQGLSDVFE
jgi:hypothetical protein